MLCSAKRKIFINRIKHQTSVWTLTFFGYFNISHKTLIIIRLMKTTKTEKKSSGLERFFQIKVFMSIFTINIFVAIYMTSNTSYHKMSLYLKTT